MIRRLPALFASLAAAMALASSVALAASPAGSAGRQAPLQRQQARPDSRVQMGRVAQARTKLEREPPARAKMQKLDQPAPQAQQRANTDKQRARATRR